MTSLSKTVGNLMKAAIRLITFVSTLLHAKFSSASHQGLANFVASRVAMRDIKSFKLVVRNTKKFVADERTVKHFSVQTCTS